MSMIRGCSRKEKEKVPDVSGGSDPKSHHLENFGELESLTFPSNVVKANAGVLTNFEVLAFLKSRGASQEGTTRVIAPIATSEYKVYDYLMETPASTQTRESVTNLSNKCKDFKLTKAEIFNIINLRPSNEPGFESIIENIKQRKINIDGLEELVNDLLPPQETHR